TIRCRELWLAAERDRADHLARSRVDHCRVLTATIEGKDTIGSGIVQDRIRTLAHRHGLNRLQGIHIEDRYLVGSAIADKATLQLRGESDAVTALGIQDIADQLPILRADDLHMGSPCNEEAMPGRVAGQIIPATISTDRITGDLMVG